MFFAKIMGVALNGLLAVERRMARRFESSRLLGARDAAGGWRWLLWVALGGGRVCKGADRFWYADSRAWMALRVPCLQNVDAVSDNC